MPSKNSIRLGRLERLEQLEPGGEAESGLFLSLEVVGVDLGIFLPLLRNFILRKNRVHRTYRNTAIAVDAVLRINVEHIVLVGAMNAVHGAYVDAGFVLDADTGLRDYVGHTWILPFKRLEKESQFVLSSSKNEREVLKVACTYRKYTPRKQ